MYDEGATVGMRLDETFSFLFSPAVVSPATFLSARCRFVVTLPTEPAQTLSEAVGFSFGM